MNLTWKHPVSLVENTNLQVSHKRKL